MKLFLELDRSKTIRDLSYLTLATFAGLTLATLATQAATDASGSKKVLNFALINEPPQMNSMKATDQVSFMMLGHVMEGLTRYGKSSEIVPGVATDWKIDDKKAVFHLRKNALWSDGKPVTAKDFVFAWSKALEPSMASEYAFVLYPIKNAEAINTKGMAPSKLGVVAKDDYTLEITFEKPCGYFLSLTPFAAYLPVREDFYAKKKDRYGADAGDMLYNGPFVLTSWVHGASLTMDRNPHYWNKAAVGLDQINVPYITSDTGSQLNFFKDKKIDVIERLQKDDLPKAQNEGFKLRSFADGTLYFMEFNFREGRPTANLNLRKAISLIFHPEEYVSKVIGIPNTKPGKGLVPQWVRGAKDTFRKEYPLAGYKQNLAEAKKYADLARKELGGKIPPLTWLCTDQPLSNREAEYFQNLFKNYLGIDLLIDKQIFKQRLEKMKAGQFDIVSAGWGADFADPMTFAELVTSWNDNNRGRYVSAKVDAHVRAAQATANVKVRMDEMAKAEKIALDELAILPLYERTIVYVASDRVQGIVRHIIGPDPDFTYVTLPGTQQAGTVAKP